MVLAIKAEVKPKEAKRLKNMQTSQYSDDLPLP